MQVQVAGFHILISCLNLSKDFRFSYRFGTGFHIAIPLKHSASVPYRGVFVLGNLSRMLFRRLYEVTFKSKNSSIMGGLMWFTDLHISINYVQVLFSWKVQEPFLINKISKFASSIWYITRRLRLWILLIRLFAVLLQNIHIYGEDVKVA